MPTGKGATRAFKIATAQAKKSGAKSFKKGSRGAVLRGQIAEAIAMHKSPMGFGKRHG